MLLVNFIFSVSPPASNYNISRVFKSVDAVATRSLGSEQLLCVSTWLPSGIYNAIPALYLVYHSVCRELTIQLVHDTIKQSSIQEDIIICVFRVIFPLTFNKPS